MNAANNWSSLLTPKYSSNIVIEFQHIERQYTGLSVNYLLMGSGIASKYQTTYDRLMVVDKSGIFKHKGLTQSINDISGTKTWLQNLLADQPIAIAPEIEITENKLFQNSPNPVNEATMISFALKTKAPVTISLFDISGRKIKELLNGDFAEGIHSFELKKGSIHSGVYFYKMVSGDFAQTKKFMVP